MNGFIVTSTEERSGRLRRFAQLEPYLKRMEREATISPEDVLVDYDHPHGRLEGVKLSDLLSTPVELSRPILAISSPRTTDGEPLDWKQLRKRTKKGDLIDPRIRWSAT